MSRFAPVSSEEAREAEETARGLGITVDDLRRRMAADLENRDRPRWRPAGTTDPARFKLPPETIALGTAMVAEYRKQLAARRARTTTGDQTT